MIPMYFSAGLIPTYLLYKNLNMLNTVWVLIRPLIYSAYNILIMKNYFQSSIPDSLEQAAFLDGVNNFQILLRVVLPLLKPVLVTVMVLTFLNTWNEFVMPLYFLGSSTKWPMTLAVYNFFGMYFKDWNLVCADIVLTSAPVILVYLLGQKYIVAGMTAGAIKG
jgi:raffinose/stachyose/melibiose transport system permease protein